MFLQRCRWDLQIFRLDQPRQRVPLVSRLLEQEQGSEAAMIYSMVGGNLESMYDFLAGGSILNDATMYKLGPSWREH